MPSIEHARHRFHYEVAGEPGQPTFVMVNGLTQYGSLWKPYVAALTAEGFRVATFDLLGQGRSDKPALSIAQQDQVAVLQALVETLGPPKPTVAGISFGGVVALRHAIEHGDSIAGLVAMSTFAELSPQLALLGEALRKGLVLGGVSYLQDLLLPMNLSDRWLAEHMGELAAVKRPGWLANDLHALQSLMQSFADFEPLTPRLGAIRVPTMIVNGEFDFLTPRALHDQLRAGIPDSALVIVQRGYHAFTLEQPELTASLLSHFARAVKAGRWKGGGSRWIAPETPHGRWKPFPSGFDLLRAVPVAATRRSRG